MGDDTPAGEGVATVGDLEDAIVRGASPAEIDATFGDAWLRIHAAVRYLCPDISTRLDVTYRDGLRALVVEHCRPFGRAITGAELRVLPLDAVAELLESAAGDEATRRIEDIRAKIVRPFVATLLGDTDERENCGGDPRRETPLVPAATQINRDPSRTTKPKRSTERGEGRAKLIAALTKHHQYADGGCLNLEPIGNNALARLADVDQATASAFFKQEFKGHAKYKAACADATLLASALKMLNGEFSPHLLYGAKPADEGDRDEE